MENIPNLSYDSSDISLPLKTKSIVIDESSDEFTDAPHNLYHDDGDFAHKIERLKQENTQKFKTRWEEILDKYSRIDDNVASDEIDLNTGQITIDNGHLKSLAGQDPRVSTHLNNIWSADYDGEKERRVRERRLKEKKLEQKLRLKQMQLFHNSSSDSVDDIPKRPSSTSLEDNLLLNPSPTKRSKLSLSPIRGNSILDESPTKGTIPIPEDDSPIKRKNAKDKEPRDPRDPRISTAQKVPFVRGRKLVIGEERETVKEDYTSTVEDEFEEEYSVLTDFIETPDPGIFHCAFECFYTTGNKALYQNHLLEKHNDALHSLGYPVSGKVIQVSAKSAYDLNKQFPAKFAVPPLALSKDGQPFYCNLSNGDQKCRRFFLSAGELRKHQESNSCSYKQQVLVCPLLGCGYMTDGGYMEWRDHFIAKGHHLDPSQDNVITSTSPVRDRYTNIRRDEPIGDSIDELFSDDSGFEMEPEDSEDDSSESTFNDQDNIENNLSSLNDKESIEYLENKTNSKGKTNLKNGPSRVVPSPPRRQVTVRDIPNLWDPSTYEVDFSGSKDDELNEFFDS